MCGSGRAACHHQYVRTVRQADGSDPVRGSRWLRIVIAVLLLAGVAGLVAAALVGDQDDSDITVSSSQAVNQLFPARGDEVLQQSRVGIDLDARYRLTQLLIYLNDRFDSGIDVTSEVNHVSGLNLWEYVPGEGRRIAALSPDTNCATANYALIAQPENTGTISWCFEVS